jgi:hypothetical protein
MNSVTQDMKFRQSLMIYAQKYGVSRASRKYNKSRSFIYFWMARYDGTLESLACRSRRPHSHPNQHTPAELKLIRDMRRRNPDLGMIELWSRYPGERIQMLTLFEATAAKLHIRHKLIRPYTPRHNGKVERSHNMFDKPTNSSFFLFYCIYIHAQL